MNTFTCTPQHLIHFCSFLTLLFVLSPTTQCVDPFYEACAPVNYCGQHLITYPFYIHGQNSSCGFPGFIINCTEFPILQLNSDNYIIDQIFYNNQSVRVYNAAVLGARTGCFPDNIRNISLVGDVRFGFINQPAELVLFANCSTNLSSELVLRHRVECGAWDLAMNRGDQDLGDGLKECEVNVVAPVEGNGASERVWELMRRGFMLNWVAANCSDCQGSGGRCGFDFVNFHAMCFCSDRAYFSQCQSNKSHLKVILATVSAITGGFITSCLLYIIWRRHNWNYVTYLPSRNTSSDPSPNDDFKGGSVNSGISIFPYRELEEATNNFDSSIELGCGGFGTVYYGKLHDGRQVAVKRLYEQNQKRIEQFMNEIQILARMRHRNLVVLYGCTSLRSHELLLVYEYIPNGTVADHLHGDQGKTGSLSWSIRMNIAIETASALAYLHASDIIHRDVKTNNLLLDTNFHVKVADFGLSRLFPINVTHVSTAPQGTPGYLDPEYHQSYQLTYKSDVYSFGVVLIELISSMPAVDVSRDVAEINLATLAINKIQTGAFQELIDPSLGFESDDDVKRMTTSIVELAFRCLQLEKEMRPKMEEVLQTLKKIKGDDDEYKVEKIEGNDNVTAKWVSSSSSTISITSG